MNITFIIERIADHELPFQGRSSNGTQAAATTISGCLRMFATIQAEREKNAAAFADAIEQLDEEEAGE